MIKINILLVLGEPINNNPNSKQNVLTNDKTTVDTKNQIIEGMQYMQNLPVTDPLGELLINVGVLIEQISESFRSIDLL